MDFNSILDMIPAGIIGSVSTFVAKISWDWYKERTKQEHRNNSQAKKNEIEEKSVLTEQFYVLLQESNSYRKEVREDLIRMREEFDIMKSQYDQDLLELKNHYENELKNMQDQVASLTEEVKRYRQENGALHLLLRERGIEVPSWIAKKE